MENLELWDPVDLLENLDLPDHQVYQAKMAHMESMALQVLPAARGIEDSQETTEKLDIADGQGLGDVLDLKDQKESVVQWAIAVFRAQMEKMDNRELMGGQALKDIRDIVVQRGKMVIPELLESLEKRGTWACRGAGDQ